MTQCSPVFKHQKGAAAVEFALVASVFLTLLLGIMYFGVVLFYWNSAAEATRHASRVAVVCNPDSSALVLAKMKAFLPNLSSGQVSLVYSPAGCDVNSCTKVTVGVQGYTFNLPLPLPAQSLTMPPFTTTLTRESLDSTNNNICN